MLLPGVPVVQAEEIPEEVEVRHGAIAGWQDVAVEAGITVVAQGANDSAADSELTSSFDLVANLPLDGGELVVYVEGNTSPSSHGVSALLPEANADAGSALDRDGNGRLQVSELHYLRRLDEHGALIIGLLDPTASLDTSEVANDETTQFLDTSLVNNPSIEFPDYTLGMVYNREMSDNFGFTLLLTGSNGLGDNPDASYAQLVDVNDDGKGVFAAAELGFARSDYVVRGGVWINTADHAELDGPDDSEDNYGVYAVVDGAVGEGAWNVRLGAANDKVSQTAGFASVAVEYPAGPAMLGLGVARSWLSDEDKTPDLDDATQAEVYARFDVRDSFSLTPSLQWLENSGFDASNSVVDDSVLVYSLRANLIF
jgi:hypothetical protein